jgi:HK97 gp10 family phage protein
VEVRWRNVNEVVAHVQDPLDEIAKQGAEDMANEMRRIVVKGETGLLSEQITVEKSQFEHGGYLVIAQASGNYDTYYASFVEFGTDKMNAQPFMRPAIKKYRPIIQRRWTKSLSAEDQAWESMLQS